MANHIPQYAVRDPQLADLDMVRIIQKRDPAGAPAGFEFVVRMRLADEAGAPVKLLGVGGVEATGESATYPTLTVLAAAVKARYGELGILPDA